MSLAYRLRVSQLASLLLLGSSCSVLYDLSPDQCERSSDCASFGSGYVCEAGLCKSTNPGSGGSNTTGGSDNSGGTSGGGKGGLGGGGVNDAGAGGDGGSGGVPPPECTVTADCDVIYGFDDPRTCVEGQCEPIPPECSTHAECFTKYGESEPLACVRGQCTKLLSDECPVVLPRLTGSDDIFSLLKSSNATILGAITYVDPGTLDGITVRNFDLALQEFKTRANGVVLNNQRRNVVMVVCSSNGLEASQLLTAGKHLAYDLDVPALISALPADDTQGLFETFRSERGKNVFFLMPNYTDETLINLEDDNLIWHMLSGADSLAAAYAPLLQRSEALLRSGATPAVAAAEDMRVAVITATDERFLNDFGDSIRANVRFNGGKTAAENGPANFVSEGTTSYFTDTAFDQTPLVTRLIAFKPHVVIGATGEEMADKIIPALESRWATEVGTTQARPFYLVSPFLYNSSYLNKLASARTRIAGVNWAAAEDRTIYNEYMSRYQLAFSRRDEGYENWYDAAYYLVYALAGGRTPEATAISAGFKRLLAGTAYEVGQTDMTPVLNQLAKPTGDLRLIGANGPPNWNTTTGGRNDAGSVWCINTGPVFVADALRYQPPPQTGGDATLTGTFPCFSFPPP